MERNEIPEKMKVLEATLRRKGASEDTINRLCNVEFLSQLCDDPEEAPPSDPTQPNAFEHWYASRIKKVNSWEHQDNPLNTLEAIGLGFIGLGYDLFSDRSADIAVPRRN